MHHKNQHNWCALLALLLSATNPVFAAEIKSSLKDQQDLSLTVYNNDLALIRDVRKVPLSEGRNRIAIREISARILTPTVIIKNLSQPDSLSLLEQNFDYDLLTPEKLLQKFVGRQIQVIKTHPTTGAEQETAATVLSAHDGVVLRIGDRIETGVPGRIVYDEVPDNLRDRPTLSVLADSAVGGEQTLALSYLSGGLGWQADYVANLNNDDTSIDINGWVTLDNQSGASYKSAKLQLVAGDVNRVSREERDHLFLATTAVSERQSLQEEELFEYHLYTLGHRTDVLQNQSKQVALMSAGGVQLIKEYVLRYSDWDHSEPYRQSIPSKVGVYVEFENTEENGLGIPLPGGTVRTYKNDSSGNAQFIGEDRITHTPKNETVRLRLGDAFDVTAKRTQTEYEEDEKKGKDVIRAAYEIEIHNAKEEDVVVRVLEPMGRGWKIVKSSVPYKNINAHTTEWSLKVPAEQRMALQYMVERVLR